ncbi:oxidoreductase [Ilyonectria destructans]|nr:oxidoreductase [Ilyonectria destructans]
MASLTLRKSVIVTGAAGGIGQAVATLFAKLGCHQLLLVDLKREELDETKRQIVNKSPNARILVHNCDLSANDSAENILNSAVEAFGRVDHVANVAGIPGGFFRSTETSPEMWDRVQQVNVRGTYFLQRAAIQQMLKQEPVENERGSIVNIGSMVSHIALPRLSAYITSKHAVLGMTRADAIDYAADGIRINCVAPGLIQTNLGAAIPKEIAERELNPVREKTPMNRFGTAEEVANCAAFLCSPLASYVTGASLAVDGGYTAA